ncbi:hypothetical protein ACKVMT_07030 [Halobacteriales archaeon Cl-PHB]
MSAERQEWTPPGDYDFGEGTQQARQARDDPDEEPAPEWWTDAYEMRMRFGIPEFDVEEFDYDVYPDCLIHEKPAEETKSAGGTDWLKIGERGSGKSNDSLAWTERLLEVNDERVVWRGSPLRSEWLPFKEWTTLWLPENASVDVDWQTEGEHATAPDDADLNEVVREVVRYDDPVDLVEQLEDRPPGTFNVVYPDPSFTNCTELTRRTDRVNEALPFVPEWKTLGNESGTPLAHWWYAFMLAAVDHRSRYTWLSVVFDEAGDLSPEDAEDDEHKTFKKLTLLRSIYSDSRRRRLSIYWAAHYEENLHHKIRREVEWRIDMADETPNPRTKFRRSIPVGFGTVPMKTDIMSHRPVGYGLLYNQNEFQLYKWTHIDRNDLGERWLKIELAEPEDDDEEEADPTSNVRYDPAVFERWQKGGKDRLYVKDPGEGYIDLQSGQEAEPLASPRPEMQFSGLEDRGETIAIHLQPDDDPEEVEVGESVLVAEFPKRDLGLDDFETDLQEANP